MIPYFQIFVTKTTASYANWSFLATFKFYIKCLNFDFSHIHQTMHIEWELRWRKKEIESENECKREMRKAMTAMIRLFEKKAFDK